VTGCGVDETAVQVLARLQEGEHAAHAVRDRALSAAEAMSPAGTVVVANPLATQRDDVIDLTLPVPENWSAVGFELPGGRVVPAQEVSRTPVELASEQVRSADLPGLMHRVHDRELFGLQMRDLEIDEAGQRLTFQLADRGDPDFDAIAAEARLRSAAAASGPDAVWDVITADEPRRRLAAVIPAPPLGWTAVRVTEMTAPVPVTPAAPASTTAPASESGRHGIRQGDRLLDNGLVHVRVDDDGNLTVTGDGATLRGVGRLVDGGDPGDSYNYAPPAHDVLVSEPTQVSVTPSAARAR
jgi:alpha-mannosidase